MEKHIVVKTFLPSSSRHPIIGFQSKETRAINVGYLKKTGHGTEFIPGRLNLGQTREEDTYKASVQTLRLKKIQKILHSYPAHQISTITILRETLACRLSGALSDAGIPSHFGDCFIGASHIKTEHSITTKYAYENVEGLCDAGLWILADSIAEGRNLTATLTSLLSKFHPKEIILICPIGNRYGINAISKILATHNVPTTFVVWGALFGLEETMHYDEPWGLPDCEPIDTRDRETFVGMYGPNLCVGGDFGNDYYCPPLALQLYESQLKLHNITPHIPTTGQILKIYTKEELVMR